MITDRKKKPQNRVEESFIHRYGSWLAMSCLALLITGCSCTGGYAYVVVSNNTIGNIEKNGIVRSYAIDGKTGQLKEIGTVDTERGPYSITVDPSGKHAYVANIDSSTVSQYAIGADGKLTYLNKAECGKTDPPCSAPISVAITPLGQYAYVASVGGKSITKITIGTEGKLTDVSTFTTDFLTDSIAIDPYGKYAYAVNRDNCNSNVCTVSQYNIKAGGLWKPMNPATVETGLTPYSITVDRLGQYAYVANNGGNTVSQYKIEVDGKLTPADPPIPTGSRPATVAIAPSGKYAYVPNSGNDCITGGCSVSRYTVNTGGVLKPMSPKTVTAGSTPFSIAFERSGKFAYVVSQQDVSVTKYKIDDDGTLSDPVTIVVGEPHKQNAMSVATVRKNHWWHIW